MTTDLPLRRARRRHAGDRRRLRPRAARRGPRSRLLRPRRRARAAARPQRVNALLGRAVGARRGRRRPRRGRAWRARSRGSTACSPPCHTRSTPSAARAAVAGARVLQRPRRQHRRRPRGARARRARRARAGVSVVPDCGLAPGLGNILAAWLVSVVPGAQRGPHPVRRAAAEAAAAARLQARVQHRRPHQRVLGRGRVPARRPHRARPDAHRGREPRVPGAGRTRRGVRDLAAGRRPRPRRSSAGSTPYDYKTVRYPGHVEKVRAARGPRVPRHRAGRGRRRQVSPREVLHAVAAPHLTFPEDHDLVVLRVSCSGQRRRRTAAPARPARLLRRADGVQRDGADDRVPGRGVPALPGRSKRCPRGRCRPRGRSDTPPTSTRCAPAGSRWSSRARRRRRRSRARTRRGTDRGRP